MINEKDLEHLQSVYKAAEKLVRCKGRYHSELNYKALAKLFGVTVPDLEPLEEDKWISVEDSLPRDMDTVLCVDLVSELTGYPIIADYVNEKFYDNSGEEVAVKKWQYLPKV